MLAAVAVSVAAAAPAAGRALSPSARRSSTSAVTFAGKACINARAVPAVATFLHSGEGLHLTIGAVVWVVLVGPASWPPRVAYADVVKHLCAAFVPFCTSIYPASAPLNWTVFRALRPGRAVVNAPLTPAWTTPSTRRTGQSCTSREHKRPPLIAAVIAMLTKHTSAGMTAFTRLL